MSDDEEIKIYVMCPLHGKPGRSTSAVVKPHNDGVMALCPGCIAHGKRIREDSGLQFGVEKVGVKQKKEPKGIDRFSDFQGPDKPNGKEEEETKA